MYICCMISLSRSELLAVFFGIIVGCQRHVRLTESGHGVGREVPTVELSLVVVKVAEQEATETKNSAKVEGLLSRQYLSDKVNSVEVRQNEQVTSSIEVKPEEQPTRAREEFPGRWCVNVTAAQTEHKGKDLTRHVY